RLTITYLLLFIACSASAQNVEPWRDSSLTFEQRAEDLLSRLTVEEKLRWFSSDIPSVQRLNIPSYMWYGEALHGVISWGVTSFPQNNAMGATWDKDLMFDVATAISDEARALHSAGRSQVMMFSPTVNMSRDPRWGRNEECYSEDPYMMSQLAKMYVRGMQGTHPKYLKTICTVKHYAANNVEHKREQIQSIISETDLREYYLPPYKACVVEERAGGIMSALNGLNNEPCASNKWLLTDVLRDEWGFEGYMIADWAGVGAINKFHRAADSNTDAAVMALLAGCDQECFRPNASPYVNGLIDAYNKELITEAEIDKSLLRLLRLRFMVNGFWLDEECPYNNTPMDVVESEEHKMLALKAAEKSIVLLKNEQSILPLNEDLKSIAVVGPFADRCWLGIYSGAPKERITPLDGIKSRFKGEVNFAQGCAVTEKSDTLDMSKAIAAARKSDVVIAFVGNDESTATENRDRQTLALPGRQQQLLDELCKVNSKVIVVLVPSGPTTIGDAQQKAKGVVCMWAAGQQQGNAIANVLFGDVNPGAKVSTTWYASDSDLPDMHDYNIRNNRTYMYFKGKPLYPFGFGLSYTTFAISNMQFSSKKVAERGELTVTVDVTNTGKVAGDEVVQLYIKDNATKSYEATKMLKGFERVTLKSGETKRVSFRLSYDAFSHWSIADSNFAVTAGTYEIMVGNSSDNTPLKRDIKVAGGLLPEHSLRTYSYDDYDSNPRYRSKYYGGAIQMPKVQPRKVVDKSKGPQWIEYMIKFVDPGFYVSEWSVTVNYTSSRPNTSFSVEYDGVKVLEGATLTGSGESSQNFALPKPDYDLPTRVRLIFESGVEIKSLDVVWPKDDSVTKYDKVFDKK
ncbi:MAG: glycoside hydrolase family 3 C-terminal domain-containing protein, partial [Rikenellaceae bacterium]